MSDCDNNCSLIDYIKSSNPSCGGFELQNCQDTNTILDLVDEHLNIGGATINVFKLLGVHEQGKLMDVTGRGTAISNGDGPGYLADNAFNKLCGTWRSVQRGAQVLTHAFLGYDFGPITDNRTDDSYYGINTYKHKHIATIRIQQGASKQNRATKVRVERSLDGITWIGASVVNLPDDGNLNQISLKGSAACRYWRIRPITFNGGDADFWEVARLEMHEYEETQLSNIQYDGGFLENRDRDYAETSVSVKMYYDLVDVQTELTKYGFELETQQLYFTASFKQCVLALGRPVVIGDILEIPSEIQYTPDLRAVQKYMEVTDVSWSIEGYTPGWQPTMQRIIAIPMLASQETLDITGEVPKVVDDIGFMDLNDSKLVDLTTMNDRIRSELDLNSPQRGKDIHGIRFFDEEEVAAAAAQGVDLAKLNQGQRILYAEDAIPPNNEPYTEGDTWPKNPSDGDWHRLTYSSTDTRIPAKLFKYSAAKSRWIYYETDRRSQYNLMKPSIQEALLSNSKTASTKVTK